jgi:hypothetical protein
LLAPFVANLAHRHVVALIEINVETLQWPVNWGAGYGGGFAQRVETSPAIRVIASEAKQSSAEAPHWIASSLRSSQ